MRSTNWSNRWLGWGSTPASSKAGDDGIGLELAPGKTGRLQELGKA